MRRRPSLTTKWFIATDGTGRRGVDEDQLLYWFSDRLADGSGWKKWRYQHSTLAAMRWIQVSPNYYQSIECPGDAGVCDVIVFMGEVDDVRRR